MAKPQVLFYLSIYLAVFFFWVFAVNLFKWEATLIGVFWELLMLPSLATLVLVTGYTLVQWVRKDRQAAYLRVFILLAIPWAIVAWLTFMSLA